MKSEFRLHGKPLTLLRIQNGLKVIEVAEELNVTPQHISQCEASKRRLTHSMTSKFLMLIGCTEEEARRFVHVVGHHRGGIV